MLFRVTKTVMEREIWYIEAESREELGKILDAEDFEETHESDDFETYGPEFDYDTVY